MEENKNELTNEVTEETVSPEAQPEVAEEAENPVLEETIEAEFAAEEAEESEDAFEEGETEVYFVDPSELEETRNPKPIVKILVSVAAIVLTVVLTLVLTPRIKYLWAMHLVNSGDYQGAYDVLYKIGGSYERAENELKRFVKTYEAEEVSGETDAEKQTITYKYEFKKNYQKKITEQSGTQTEEELFYDKNGNVVKKIEVDMYGTKITTEYEYDKDGNPTKISASNDYAELVSKNKYDKNGNCIETEQTYKMGEQSQKQKVVIKNHSMQYIKK